MHIPLLTHPGGGASRNSPTHSVYEMNQKGTKFANFYDSVSGASSSTCQGMGSQYAWRTFSRYIFGTYTQ